MQFPVLTSERLVLRQLEDSDKNEIFAIRSDEKMSEFIDRPKAQTVDDAVEFIKKVNEGITKNEILYWAISLKDNQKLIGTICLWNIPKDRSKAEIGFELLPDHQGRGIAQEAIKIVIDHGFGSMQLDLIEAMVAPGNIKSIKILEKFSFRREKDNPENNDKSKDKLEMVLYVLSKDKNWK